VGVRTVVRRRPEGLEREEIEKWVLVIQDVAIFPLGAVIHYAVFYRVGPVPRWPLPLRREEARESSRVYGIRSSRCS
jgi:hypothetical protein